MILLRQGFFSPALLLPFSCPTKVNDNENENENSGSRVQEVQKYKVALRASLLTLGITQASLVLLSLNRRLQSLRLLAYGLRLTAYCLSFFVYYFCSFFIPLKTCSSPSLHLPYTCPTPALHLPYTCGIVYRLRFTVYRLFSLTAYCFSTKTKTKTKTKIRVQEFKKFKSSRFKVFVY